MTRRTWPMVGRAPLVRSIATLLEDGSNVVVTGKAGMGKTTLAKAVAEDYHGLCQRIVATPAAAPLPLAAITSLVGQAVGRDALLAARSTLGLSTTSVDAHARPPRVPPLLVVDDVNALDEASATVLHQLLAGGECRLLATMRRGAPVSQAVDRVRRTLDTVEIEAPPLPDDAIVSMVELALGGTLTERARARLVTSAQGNPMYARELVEGSLAARTLTAHGSAYSFRGEPVATPHLEELVMARLAPLGPDQVRALEYLALCAPLSLRLLSALVGEEHLEAMERDGLIVARPGHDLLIDVGHPLYRDMTRARLGPLSRMRVHRQLLEAMDRAIPASERTGEQQLSYVTWALRSGAALDPDAALAAARHAAAAGDTELAVEFADHAITHGSVEATLFAAHCASITGRHDRSAALLGAVEPTVDDPWTRTAVLIKLAEEVWGTGDLAAGASALGRAAAIGGETQVLVAANRAVHRVLGGDLVGGLAEGHPLVQHPHAGVRYSACVATQTGLIFTDRADEAIAVADAYLANPGAVDLVLVGDPGLPNALRLMAKLVAGDITEAVEVARQRFELCSLDASAQSHAWASMLVGMASEASGDLDWAARALADGERSWVDVGIWGSALWCGALLVRTHAMRGDVAAAEDALARVESYVTPPDYIGNRFAPYARAWVATLAGKPAEAASVLAQAAEVARRSSEWTGWFEAWHEAARLGVLDPMRVALFDEGPEPGGRLSAARAGFVRGLARQDAALLADSARRFRECGALLFAAEAAQAAASALRVSGRPREAAEADALAAALRADVPAANTPLLGGRRSASGVLTSRELEIATLAASGLSNRAIAERLVVSERTIENHLYRVFIKLGVSGRDQLSSALLTH